MSEAIAGIVGVLLGGGLLVGIAALMNARTSRSVGISGDEREARRDEAAQRRDTIADRDAWITTMSARVEDLEQKDREKEARIVALERERDDWHQRYLTETEYSRALLDWGYRGAPPPPPPRPTGA